MMRPSFTLSLLLIGFLTLLTGCTITQGPLLGSFYSNVKTGTNVAEGQLAATKTGKSCAMGMLGFAWGDASIEAAMAAGGITKISFVDHTYVTVLFIYGEYCTIVNGT